MNKNYYKTAFNWIAPVIVVVIIITGEILEGLIVAIAYVIYRLFDERDKVNSYKAKRRYLKGQYHKSLKLYEKAFKTNKAEPKVCISYCYNLLLLNQTQRASEVYALITNMSGIEKIKPQILICEKLLLYKQDNRLIKAIMDLERADEDLQTTSYRNILTKLYIENNDLQKAKTYGEESYRYNKGNVHLLENLLRIYCLLEDYERALKVMPTLVKEKPFTYNTFYYMGLAYEKNNEMDKAAVMYKKAEACEKTIFSYSNK